MTIILGIDPGSRTTGYGIVRELKGRIEYIDSGCIRTTDMAQIGDRLLRIFSSICKLLEIFIPHEVAVEQVFMHQNANTALKLGHARGAAMVACASHNIPISEYAPRVVKQAVAGYGAASKDQVKAMVMRMLSLEKSPQNDAADALAIALCHCYTRKNNWALKALRSTT